MKYFDTWEDTWISLQSMTNRPSSESLWVVPQVIGYQIQREKPDPMDIAKGRIAQRYNTKLIAVETQRSGL